MDQLYNTIRTVYLQYEPMRNQIDKMKNIPSFIETQAESGDGGGRAGHIVAIYSPQGGAGCTTLATNIASGLMKEGIKVFTGGW